MNKKIPLNVKLYLFFLVLIWCVGVEALIINKTLRDNEQQLSNEEPEVFPPVDLPVWLDGSLLSCQKNEWRGNIMYTCIEPHRGYEDAMAEEAIKDDNLP